MELEFSVSAPVQCSSISITSRKGLPSTAEKWKISLNFYL